MVKKLRKKFVITATLSLLVILVIMIAFINLINLSHTIKDTDNLLSMLTTNDGMFPRLRGKNAPENSAESKDENKKFNPQDPFTINRLNSTRSAEMPYQSRYFFVRISKEGSITETNLIHVAAVTEDIANEYALKAFNSGKEKGFLHSYRYKMIQKDDGTYLIVFVDLSLGILNAYTLLFQSLLIGAFALIAMIILVFIFSSQAVAPVVESLEKQKRFITDAGHELKTPLAVISANVDVIEIEGGKSEWTSSIRNQINRLNSLVKNMLTLSRMDEESMHVVYSDFDISASIKETASSFQTVAESRNKKYNVEIEDGIHITGDKNAINQLTSLLLDNAMKYSSENGFIHLTLSKGKNIVLEVSNSCDKFPDGNLDRLFDRFYRADSSRSRETGGFGIGLSVARAIATSHGGNIKAVKDGDRIIRFVVTLPKIPPKGK